MFNEDGRVIPDTISSDTLGHFGCPILTNIEQEPAITKNLPCNATSADITSQPSTSRNQQPSTNRNTSDQLLKQLSPLPDASNKRLVTRSRKAQKSEILTSSPFKNALVEKNVAAGNKVKATNDKKKAATNKSKAATTNKKKIKTKQNVQSLTKDLETECIICGENFDEDWIQCYTCKDWAHEACVDIDPSKPYYYCDVCKAKERFGHR